MLHLQTEDTECERRLLSRAGVEHRLVGREVIAELEVMRTLVDFVPEHLRRPVDLTGLDHAFGHVATPT